MKVKEIEVKSIITKSHLPESDYVINPYIGCGHGCIYCYARFMRRFTGHTEDWGDFVDVKINAPELIPQKSDKYKGKEIVIGSVTDPYQKVEEKYKVTRKILEKLTSFDSSFTIITKSDLVTRDIDLLKQFKNITVAISMCCDSDDIRKNVDINASAIEKRIESIKKLHENNIRTVIFISPIFPLLSDWKSIISKTKEYTDEYWFENLNVYPSVKGNIQNLLKNNYPELIGKYHDIYGNQEAFWSAVEKEIKEYCLLEKINYRIFFHHKETKKK